MQKIQLFTKWTHTAELDSCICTEEDISDQGCVGYTGQFPLCCAAAHTIHVAQSATFCDIYIDMSTNTSPPKHWWQHMQYVALS